MTKRFYLGVCATLFAGLSYAAMGAIVKYIMSMGACPGYLTIIFFQSLVAFLIVSISNVGKLSELVKTDILPWHFLRAIFGFLMVSFAWIAVKHLSVATTVLLSNTAPFFIPIIAIVFLKKSVNPLVWAVIIIGLIGVYLIDQPSHGILTLPALVGLLSGVSFAALLTVSGKLVKTESVKTIIFYYFFFSTIISAVPMLFFWTPFSETILLLLVALGVLFYLLQSALNYGVQNTTVMLNGILFYSCVVFGLLLDGFIWHLRVNTLGYVGIVVIMLSCFCAIKLEKK